MIIDAVNFNLPVITTNCRSGPSEIVKKTKGGFIVPISNPEAIAKKILFSIKNYQLAKSKANYAKKYVFRFSEKKNSEKYFNEIAKVLNEKN